ncbi:MAG: hypothetical protein STSR0002_09110 [Smithella sp.]
MGTRVKNKIIPDSNHIARYCKPTTVENDEILATAFLMRPIDESLSVNWLEYFKLNNREEEISKIQKLYGGKFRNISPNARIVVINVGEARNKVLLESEDGRNLKFKHDRSIGDPSHSGIYNLNPDNEMIAELILSVVDQEHHVYPAKK